VRKMGCSCFCGARKYSEFFSLFCGSGEISVDRYLFLPFFPGDVDLELVALRLAFLYSRHILDL
jgi:hypothetical protein